MKINTALKSLLICFLSIGFTSGFSQIKIEGYAYESGNRGWLNQVEIFVTDENGKEAGKAQSDMDGKFSLMVEAKGKYTLTASKDLFEDLKIEVDATGVIQENKVFVKAEMSRKPGYIFDITLADKRDSPEQVVDGIRNARIEVYNNTTAKSVMAHEKHESPHFRVNLIKGNHYTLLVRKEGYLAKRMEAFVDVKGCILCFEGLGTVEPGVTDNLTEENSMGTLLANVEMEKAIIGKQIELQDIYFDLGKWDIRDDAAEELDKAIVFMKDNPDLLMELGAHTDAQGTDGANQVLSEKRARSTANYIIDNGYIDKSRMKYKGYGESNIKNRCANGVKCSKAEHAQNRRTELKILGKMKTEEIKTLVQLKEADRQDALLQELLNQEQVKVPEDGEMPDALKKQMQSEKNIKKEEEIDPAKASNLIEDEQPAAIEIKTEESSKAVDTQLALVPKTEEIIASAEEVKQVQLAEIVDKINEKEEIVSEDKNGMANSPEEIAQWTKSEIELNKDNPKLVGFTGYKVVLEKSMEALKSDHPVVAENGDVLVEYKSFDGQFLYLIGNFAAQAQADKFLKTQLLSKYPNAYVQKFVDGFREIK